MGTLKDIFLDLEDSDDSSDDAVEVFADSLKQALELASQDMGIDISMLDYEILEKGTKGLFGMGRQPYRVVVRPLEIHSEHHDLEEIEQKLSGHAPGIVLEEDKNANGTFSVRVTKSGIWLTVKPPRGNGLPVDVNQINNKLYSMRITSADAATIDKESKKPSNNPVRLGDWTPNAEYDGSMHIEITEDEMKAFVHFTPPRFSGRHMEFDEVVDALKGAGAVTGLREEVTKEYLEAMDYSQPLLAAEGQKPRNGKDAYIDYKVQVEKSGVKFEEDESGKVDFRNLELLENVVVGQILAVKVPAEEGIPGRTVTNRILPAKSGKDVQMQYGKGTILSENGTELTAEINGQVVYKRGRISVEPVYVVNGDVSLETGNIVFLGSVIVSGNVQDNFVVKAAGNIEVKGTVQKAFLEAEGDIIVHQGISGREEAKIESTGGNIFAKFVQNANVVSENDVVVPEGIIHSRVDAGERIYCNGRRARIVGGLIRAGSEVNARFIGADVATKTEVKVGINPKVLQQMTELDTIRESTKNELEAMAKNLATLTNQRKTSRLSEEKENMFQELNSKNQKLNNRLNEIELELEELQAYIGMLEHKGKVCAEKTIYPGVDIYIKDQKFLVKDEYNFIKFTLEGDEIRLSEYEPPEGVDQKIATRVQRRR
jgi:uncharacterized protein (DUF342 family)